MNMTISLHCTPVIVGLLCSQYAHQVNGSDVFK